jgi:tetratricopeptide (TPR) repeat protein
VLLRYGEGNQFPDDPLRPGPADFDQAADLFDRALQIRPELPVKDLDQRLRASLTARSLFCRGRALAYRGQFDQARQILEQAQAADPLLPEPYNAIGITYLEQAQYKMAVPAFRESIRVAPDWAYPRHNLALTYIEMGDNAAAEAEYRAAITRTPEHPYLYYNLGVLLQRINRRGEAGKLFQEAIAKFEQQAAIYRQRAADLNREDSFGHPDAKPEAALAEQQARTGLRNEGEAYNALGALWQARGKIAKARTSYQRALALNAELSAARYNLAVLAMQQRHYTEAVDILASLVQADPAFPEAERELNCARKGQALSQTRDGETKRRLRQQAAGCAI